MKRPSKERRKGWAKALTWILFVNHSRVATRLALGVALGSREQEGLCLTGSRPWAVQDSSVAWARPGTC